MFKKFFLGIGLLLLSSFLSLFLLVTMTFAHPVQEILGAVLFAIHTGAFIYFRIWNQNLEKSVLHILNRSIGLQQTSIQVKESLQSVMKRSAEQAIRIASYQSAHLRMKKLTTAMNELKRKSQSLEELSVDTKLLMLNSTLEAIRAGSQSTELKWMTDGSRVLTSQYGKTAREIGTILDAIEMSLEKQQSRLDQSQSDLNSAPLKRLSRFIKKADLPISQESEEFTKDATQLSSTVAALIHSIHHLEVKWKK